MTWIKANWRWGALNLFAVLVLVYVLTQGSTDWNNTDTFDPGLESGKWAIRFLLACLTMTPLNTYLGWSGAIRLRKPAGLWVFGFASLHTLLYIRDAKLDWLTISMPFYLALGLAGMSILSALAITSNRLSMKRLGKHWKRLHRLVYFSGIAVVTHSMLAATMSKKIYLRDSEGPGELRVYVAVLSILLVVRVPVVRQILRQISSLLKRRRKPALQIGHAAMPDGGAELWPRIQGRESSVSLRPTLIIPNEIPNQSELSGSGGPFKRIMGSDISIDRLAVKDLPEEEARVR